MGILEDFDGLKKAWPNLSTPAKLILGISFFTSALSLASVSDSVFKFKGFILDAIKLYRDLTSPLVEVIEDVLQVSISQLQIDSVIICSLIYISSTKAYERIDAKRITKDIIGIGLAVLLIIYVNEETSIKFALGLLVYILFCGLVGMHSKFWNDDSFNFSRRTSLNIVALVIFVGFVAAVSEGATRIL